MKKRTGSVLVHVLVTSVIVSVIAAGLMQMMLMRATIQARASEGAVARKKTESAFNTIMTRWNEAQRCAQGVPGFSGGNASGNCNCNYTSTDGTITAGTTLVGTRCRLDIEATP